MDFFKRLHWRRPLFYALLPIFLVLAFVGFPPPIAPPPGTRPQQEHSVPADEHRTGQQKG